MLHTPTSQIVLDEEHDQEYLALELKYPELCEYDTERNDSGVWLESDSDIATVIRYIKVALKSNKPIDVAKLSRRIALELEALWPEVCISTAPNAVNGAVCYPDGIADIELIRCRIGVVIRRGKCGVCVFIVKRKSRTYIVTHRTATEAETAQHEKRLHLRNAELFAADEDDRLSAAEHMLAEAIRVIDAKYGEGYAGAHPGLLTAYMLRCR